jgi:wyosine [tRNA(Phe)-imidazoG37] synthetase (radical SAM superfamily)
VTTLQAQRDIQETVFGPYDSRRFGKSLGVNPLPKGARLCNFDCIYCECATATWPLEWLLRPQFPTAEEIHDALLAAADTFGSDDLDSITISGNGEPTLSPHLNAIVDVVNAARDRDWPQARTVILSNGTMCHKTTVQAAIAKLDERVIKLDAGTNWILEQLNRPTGKLCVTELLRRISMMPDIVVQSMFVHGPVDNTSPNEIERWAGWLAQLRPTSVQIYSLDRLPAKRWVRPVPRKELESIAEYVESTIAIPTHVFEYRPL